MKDIIKMIGIGIGILGTIIVFLAIVVWIFPGDSAVTLRDNGQICKKRWYWFSSETTTHCYVEIKDRELLPPNVNPESKKWKCKTVVTCEHVDWRYFDPEDVCTYEMMTFTMLENPETHPDTKRLVNTNYGGWCKEINKRE